ncbi:phage integrase family protein [Klebsiella oxytoca]|uniref:tyrosine-type recombinase/integrase n=1 Tax=Klebsiella oxytoca TaxID=571 RepID=UPI00190EEEEF|nr:tyrosine-type recombinase/integrase [Klebsiella oxytoca]MBK0679086.1 phage integrase family protein [Klebsiella oxytoca]
MSSSSFRTEAIKQGFPRYILSSEINIILHYIPNVHDRIFIETLWNTGATINEAIILNRKSFTLKSPTPNVKIVNPDFYNSSIKYNDKLSRRRVIPLISKSYITQIKTLIAMVNMQDRKGYREKIWNIDEVTALSLINNSVKSARLDGINISFDITPDSIRHSFAMEMLILGVEPSIVMSLMGYIDSKRNEIYLNVRRLIQSL